MDRLSFKCRLALRENSADILTYGPILTVQHERLVGTSVECLQTLQHVCQ